MPERAARTVLAFDFGLKRIGVAVGEPALGTSHPLGAVPGEGDAAFIAIEKLLAEWQPAQLVVGVPVSADGAAHDMTRRAERFARRLEGRYRLPVARVDERFTSVEAESRLRGTRASKEQIDAVAAQLILEQFFHERAA
jgi:putative holliday junction resolvase